jgi:membrane protein DedA with SNARE-associated domain/rhodanese-related sulfurtransferase
MHEILPFLIEHGYAVLFVWVLAETIGFPLPSAPLFIAAGALAGMGYLRLPICIGLGACAALLSDVFWYSMGRRNGGRILSWLCRISLAPDDCVRKAEVIFARYGERSLLVTKFIPGLSAVTTPLAGIIRMRLSRFLFFDTLGAIIWVGSFTGFGYVFSEQLDDAILYALRFGNTVLMFLAGGLAIYILRKYALRRRFLRQLFNARITPVQLKQKIDAGEDILILDVRHALDFEADPYIIPGALHLPLESLKQQPDVPQDREVVLYCTCPNEASSARVAMLLLQHGVMRVRPLAGGLNAWRDHGYPVELLDRPTSSK